jgi:hypothetical protein
MNDTVLGGYGLEDDDLKALKEFKESQEYKDSLKDQESEIPKDGDYTPSYLNSVADAVKEVGTGPGSTSIVREDDPSKVEMPSQNIVDSLSAPVDGMPSDLSPRPLAGQAMSLQPNAPITAASLSAPVEGMPQDVPTIPPKPVDPDKAKKDFIGKYKGSKGTSSVGSSSSVTTQTGTPSVTPPDPMSIAERLKASMASDKDANFWNQIVQNAVRGGNAYAGRKEDTGLEGLKAMQAGTQSSEADLRKVLEAENVDKEVAANKFKKDPNSEFSKAARDLYKKVTNKNIKDDVSYDQLERAGLPMGKLADLEEKLLARQLQSGDLKLRREQFATEKNLKAADNFLKSYDYQQVASRTGLGNEVRKLDGIQGVIKIAQRYAPNMSIAEFNKMKDSEVVELAQSVANSLSPLGKADQHAVESMSAKSALGDVMNVMGYVGNFPASMHRGEFVRRLLEQAIVQGRKAADEISPTQQSLLKVARERVKKGLMDGGLLEDIAERNDVRNKVKPYDAMEALMKEDDKRRKKVPPVTQAKEQTSASPGSDLTQPNIGKIMLYPDGRKFQYIGGDVKSPESYREVR